MIFSYVNNDICSNIIFSHLGIWLLSLLWLVRQIMFSFLKCRPLGIGPPNFVTSWSRQDIYVYKSYAPVLCTGGSYWKWTQVQVASSLGNILVMLVTCFSFLTVNPFGMNLHGYVPGHGSILLNLVTDFSVWKCWYLYEGWHRGWCSVVIERLNFTVLGNFGILHI